MALTDIATRQAKPQDKPYKIADERGLFLLVQPSGSKLWRFKYRYQGKEKLLALGKYPDVSLAAARKLRDAARERLAADEDPGAARKATRQAAKVAADNTFEATARAWWEKWRANRTEGTADGALRSLEIHAFPRIGAMPITAIGPVDVLELLRRIEAKGSTETLKRVRARIGEIFIYAIANGIATSNPAEGLHKAVMPHTEQRRPALRAGELRCAQWPEFDLDAGVWTVPAERDRSRGLTGMKMRETHVVPLSRQAVAVLRELQDHSPGHDLLFPNRNGQGRPISDGTINSALRAMGYQAHEVTGHGFRATATGALLEMGFRPDVIDRQLAHRERKQVFAAYSHHAQFLPERTKMMQSWADYVDRLQKGADVIPFQRFGGAGA